jgi:hypothetical protein
MWSHSRGDCACKREIFLSDAIVPAFRVAENIIEHEFPVAVLLNFSGQGHIIEIESTQRVGETRAERRLAHLPDDFIIDVIYDLLSEIENMLEITIVERDDLFQAT